MKRLVGLLLLVGFFAVPGLVSAQSSDLGAGSSSSGLQGSGGSLQQPASGVQGTTPQNLTPGSGLSLNQTSRSPSGSSLRLQPSQTSTTITKIPQDKKSPKLGQIIILLAIVAVAGFVFWQRGTKLYFG